MGVVVEVAVVVFVVVVVAVALLSLGCFWSCWWCGLVAIMVEDAVVVVAVLEGPASRSDVRCNLAASLKL